MECPECGPGVVGVKCIYKYRDLQPEEAIRQKGSSISMDENQQLSLCTKSSWYYQTQCQLGCASGTSVTWPFHEERHRHWRSTNRHGRKLSAKETNSSVPLFSQNWLHNDAGNLSMLRTLMSPPFPVQPLDELLIMIRPLSWAMIQY